MTIREGRPFCSFEYHTCALWTYWYGCVKGSLLFKIICYYGIDHVQQDDRGFYCNPLTHLSIDSDLVGVTDTGGLTKMRNHPNIGSNSIPSISHLHRIKLHDP